jgi:hypothetical protein
MGKLAQRAAVAAAAVALATVGFGGVAFAGGEGEHNNIGGAAGNGGNSSTRCAVPIGLSGSVLLAQSNDVSQCNANGGGGGKGGDATDF